MLGVSRATPWCAAVGEVRPKHNGPLVLWRLRSYKLLNNKVNYMFVLGIQLYTIGVPETMYFSYIFPFPQFFTNITRKI